MAKIDTDLLFLYSENARIKIKSLSNQLKKSPQRLKYSLRALEKEDAVNNPHCIFDYSYFGLLLFRAYFKGYIGEKEKEHIIQKLKENAHITSIYEFTGEYSLAVEILASNPLRFNREMNKITAMFPELSNYKVILNQVTYLYSKNYLLNGNIFLNIINDELIIGGDRNKEEFNFNEKAVISNILRNPKTRLTRLAKLSRLNVKTAASTLKSLKQRNVIKGFKYSINANMLGIYKYRLFFRLRNFSSEKMLELKKYCFEAKEITAVNRAIGDWELEIDIEALDKNRLREMIARIREDFKDIIESFNMIEFYKYHKINYLPDYLFQE